MQDSCLVELSKDMLCKSRQFSFQVSALLHNGWNMYVASKRSCQIVGIIFGERLIFQRIFDWIGVKKN